MVSMLDSSAIRRKLAMDHIAAEREAEREREQWFAGIEDARRNGWEWLLREPRYVQEHREFRARQQQNLT